MTQNSAPTPSTATPKPQSAPLNKPKTPEPKAKKNLTMVLPFEVIGAYDAGSLYSLAKRVDDGANDAYVERRLRSGTFFLIPAGTSVEFISGPISGMALIRTKTIKNGWIPTRGLLKE